MLGGRRLKHCVPFFLMLGSYATITASAAEPPVSMAGQRVTIVVGSPAGGGYDAYGRLVGRHLGAVLPGNPGVVVQNMPGAGSLIAANWLANAAPKDGTAIAVLPTATVFEPLLGNSKARFDGRKMSWLGSLNSGIPIAAVWANTPFTSAKDLFEHEILIGSSDAGTNESRLPKLLNALIHTKFKVIDGYHGSSGIALAMERGEVQGTVGDTWDSIKATKGNWLSEKKIRILLQATLTRDVELPDVPTALEFVPAENRDVLGLLLARGTYGKLFMAPPGIPAPIAETLQQAFGRMVEDAEFKKDAAQSNLSVQFSGANDVANTIDRVLASPQATIDRAILALRNTDPK